MGPLLFRNQLQIPLISSTSDTGISFLHAVWQRRPTVGHKEMIVYKGEDHYYLNVLQDGFSRKTKYKTSFSWHKKSTVAHYAVKG